MISFKASLSPTSFENLIKQLKQYSKELEKARLDIHQALADYAYERIMFYVPVDTGQLMSSFVEEVSQDMGRVFTDLYYAKFVEFGTGIRGKESGYDVSKTNVKELNYGDSDIFLGQPAQKFVYQAYLDLERDYLTIVREVLKKKGLV